MEEKLLKFHAILETKANELEYGTMTVNVVVVNGSPNMETLNIVFNKRKKYPITNSFTYVSTQVMGLTNEKDL